LVFIGSAISWVGVREWLVVAILTVVLLGLFSVAIGNRRVDTDFYHTSRSIEMAVNWTQCDLFSVLRDPGVRSNFNNPPNPLDTGLKDVAISRGGGIPGYCDGDFEPFQNEDSGLFYLISGVLFIAPNASAMGVFWSLSGLMALCIAVFLITLWRLTTDPYVTLVVGVLCVGLYATVAVDQFLSMRTFMWPPVLLVIALLVRSHASSSYRVLTLGTFAAGVIAAVGVNLRYSYIVHYVAVLGIVVLMSSVMQLRRTKVDKRWVSGRAAAGVMSFVLGMYVIQIIFVAPLSELEVESGLTHHPVLHPVVLGLSVPENSLSKREGIGWSDVIGQDLAERVDPLANTTYERYEAALWTYYRGLWRDYPGEMLEIYARKIHEAGKFEMYFLRTRLIGFFSPASIINSGYFFGAFMVIAAVAYVSYHRSKNGSVALLVAAVTAAVLIDFGQAAAIYPRRSLYYPMLIFGLGFATVLVWSIVITRFHLVQRVRERIWRADAA
jgi:hypothetical protein